MKLSDTNTYHGPTTISGGILQFATTARIYHGNPASWTQANISVASGATLAVNCGSADDFSTANVTTLLSNIDGSVTTGGLQAGSALGFDHDQRHLGRDLFGQYRRYDGQRRRVHRGHQARPQHALPDGQQHLQRPHHALRRHPQPGRRRQRHDRPDRPNGDHRLQRRHAAILDLEPDRYSGRFSTASNQAYNIDTNNVNVTFGTGLTSSGGSLTKLGRHLGPQRIEHLYRRNHDLRGTL